MCPKDYTKALLEWVDPESLPEYLGGTSKATLLDDAGPWQDPKILSQARDPLMTSSLDTCPMLPTYEPWCHKKPPCIVTE